MNQLFQPIEPFKEGTLEVSDLHTIYYELSGNPKGKPVVFLHGGPGFGTKPVYRQLFDPKKYLIIMFDQRGCGKSTPCGELRENTTWDLVEDIEKLREKLGIDKWLVFGGSWGAALALAYSERYPLRVTKLILRGVPTMRKRELDWFSEGGVAALFPDVYEIFIQPVPKEKRGNVAEYYYERLLKGDDEEIDNLVKRFSYFDDFISKIDAGLGDFSEYKITNQLKVGAKIFFHYEVNKGFFDENQLIDNLDKIRHIPAVIIQGRYDVVCPMFTAWEIHNKWPEAELEIVTDAGHNYAEPGVLDKLIEYTDRFAN